MLKKIRMENSSSSELTIRQDTKSILGNIALYF